MRALAAPILLLLAACAAAQPQPPVAATQPGLADSSTNAADRLALEVFRAAGGEKFAGLSVLEFSFVVWDGMQKKFVAHHTWDLRSSTDHVRWTDRQGKSRDLVVDLSTKPTDKESDQAKAYARWINDSYWLVLPLKLLDPGVRRKLEEPRERDGKTYDVLRLTYDRVGLTPGDIYWLYVDRDSKRIVRWEMVLEGEPPPAQGSSWEDYRAVGPLTLAMDHREDDGKHRVAFENVSAR